MEKNQQNTDNILVWNREQSSAEETLEKTPAKKRPQKDGPQKESEEEMIRALQGIFCRGRYQSWVAYELRRRK